MSLFGGTQSAPNTPGPSTPQRPSNSGSLLEIHNACLFLSTPVLHTDLPKALAYTV